MLDHKNILAVVPARGGSKGIPRKNIKMIAGKPLIAWTVIEAKKSQYIDRLILSSDSLDIIEEAKKVDIEVPFVRPLELAGDSVTGVTPLIHAVKNIKERYDYVILLQVTSPLRTYKDIDQAIEYCIRNKCNSCISVYKTGENPNHFLSIDKNNNILPVIETKEFVPRQNIPDYYKINGAFYMIETETLLRNKHLLNQETKAFIMDKESSIDIDNISEFKMAELILKQRLNHE